MRGPGLTDAGPLPERAVAVASADALAVSAHRAGGAGAVALEQAALVRARLFRREHREADALEGQELYQDVAAASPTRRCQAELERALLRAEAGGRAEALYGALAALARGADGACRARIDAALAMLEGYRSLAPPLPPAAPSASASGEPPPSPGEAPSTQAPARAVSEGATLTHIERYSAKDAARVVVFVSKPVRFDVGAVAASANGKPRLFIDLHGADYSGAKALGAEGLLERVRAAAGNDGTRVVLDLAAEAEHRVFYVPEPFRLVIDVARPGVVARVGKGGREIRRVVLDPGHGGHDPGAIGPTGLREKDVALDIAHRAAPLIARELGISTLLTRDTDVYVPLEERTARANAFGADLFISIHCNATERSGGSGVMTFVLDDSKDQLASRIAALENSASAEATAELAQSLSRAADPHDQTRAQSGEFAGLLQRAVMASLAPRYPDVPDGGVKRAGFYVLAGARMPAVLFETSFISSARDETRFNTGDFRQKLADAVVNAIRAYKSPPQ